MLRTTALGLLCAAALGIGLASAAAAMGGHTGGHTGGGNSGGASTHAATAGRGNMAGMRSDVSGGRFAQHEMGEMRMAHDHDHDRDRDRDRHDHDRFRLFPAFAYNINSYADTYDLNYGDCWELHRAWTRLGWRLRRIWVCN